MTPVLNQLPDLSVMMAVASVITFLLSSYLAAHEHQSAWHFDAYRALAVWAGWALVSSLVMLVNPRLFVDDYGGGLLFSVVLWFGVMLAAIAFLGGRLQELRGHHPWQRRHRATIATIARVALVVCVMVRVARADDVFFPQLGVCRILAGQDTSCQKIEITAGSAPHTVLRFLTTGCTAECELMLPANVAFDAPDGVGGLLTEVAVAPADGSGAGTGDFCWQASYGAVADQEDTTAVNFVVTTGLQTVPLTGVVQNVQKIQMTTVPLTPNTVAGTPCTNAFCQGRKAYLRISNPPCAGTMTGAVDLQTLRINYNPTP